ncbi:MULTISPECIES: hypothetical protein [unclassified Halomonas]|uniref:hypothetical protein n=1 Tax=unclassified Halomonas TaxID=2609666 RepID=UPI000ADE761F|nr:MULTISPECIES: hypothetical protein [unclassified Halomonas]MBT2786315.1 hypothetical protein [Halomonas sp. ISL-106]MBT2797337.1 hypothetical protein [Halomonas sp. ISL-104]
MSKNSILTFILKSVKITIFITGILSLIFISLFFASIFFLDPVNFSEFETYKELKEEGSIGQNSWFPPFFPKNSSNITLRTNVETSDYKITFTLQNKQELADLLKGSSVTTASRRRKGYDSEEYSFWCKTDYEHDRRTHLIITNNIDSEIVIGNPYSDECRCNTL